MSWIVVNHYSAITARGGCFICVNTDTRQTQQGLEPILSTGFETFDGTPEICATCIAEAAKMIGFVSGFTYAREVEARKAADAEIKELRSLLEDKAATVRTLTAELAGALDESSKSPVKPSTGSIRGAKVKASA